MEIPDVREQWFFKRKAVNTHCQVFSWGNSELVKLARPMSDCGCMQPAFESARMATAFRLIFRGRAYFCPAYFGKIRPESRIRLRDHSVGLFCKAKTSENAIFANRITKAGPILRGGALGDTPTWVKDNDPRQGGG